MTDLDHFREIWHVDFEFCAPSGERPEPICMVAREHRSGRTLRLAGDTLTRSAAAPFDTGADSLLVAYYASAELGCFLALGWPMPERILDLYAEFCCRTSGLTVPCGRRLLGALAYFGLDAIDASEKQEMRELAMRGGPYTDAELSALVDYCESDVVALGKLLPAMLPRLDLPRALLRGRYMAAAARMEWAGTPIDAETLDQLRRNWETIKTELIAEVDREYGVYVPTGVNLDHDSRIGSAIIKTAADYGVDPHRLAVVIDAIWRDEQAGDREQADAIRTARRTTKLTPSRINRWEDRGGDHSSYPGLDVAARELAGELPELGIGAGYDDHPEADHAGRLWQLLREPAHRITKDDPDLLRRAAEMVAEGHNTYTGPLSFSAQRFADWLIRRAIPWPRLDSGALDLSDDAFRQMSRQYPEVSPLRELRHSLSQLRLNELAVGGDGRNRCLLSAFASRTGRNQPSNSMFIFGPSVWLRGLIQPAEGRAVAYVDWSQQEFGIAAALSGDRNMAEAYSSGDPYLAFAVQAGAAPADATKASHSAIRDRFKVCALAVQYGMGERSLAASLGQPECYARDLLRLHRETYPRFWRWSQAAVDYAMLRGSLHTVFGWRTHTGIEANGRSLANFPMQANGAEMLRLACCLATERGIEVCAPVHDALLIEAADDAIEAAVEGTQAAMREASAVVLEGFELRSDAKIVRHPERYLDPRGGRMWDTVCGLLLEAEPLDLAW